MRKDITFDRWAGWDTRKGKYVSDANRLLVMDNCYITKGGAIRQRPGIVKVGDLSGGASSQGLYEYGSKLYTFTSNVPLTHTITDAINIDLNDASGATLTTLHKVTPTRKGLYVTATMSDGLLKSFLVNKANTSSVKQITYDLPAGSSMIAQGLFNDIQVWMSIDDNGYVWRSYDDGDNWARSNKQVVSPSGAFTFLYYFNNRFIMFHTSNLSANGYITLYSIDGGDSWERGSINPLESNKQFESLAGVFLFSINDGYMYNISIIKDVGQAGAYRIMYSEDGINWFYSVETQPTNTYQAAFLNGQWFWIDSNTIQEVTDFTSSASWPAAKSFTGATSFFTGSGIVVNGRWYTCGFHSGVQSIIYSDNQGDSWSQLIDYSSYFVAAGTNSWAFDSKNNKVITLINSYVFVIDVATDLVEIYAVGLKAASGVGASVNTLSSNTQRTIIFIGQGSVSNNGILHIGCQKTSDYVTWQGLYDESERGAQTVALAGKIFHQGENGRIPYSATGDFTDFTSLNDAGYLPDHNNNKSAQALTDYDGRLAIFYRNAIEVWSVDPDPTLMAFVKRIENIGCQYPFSIQTISGDKVFLSDRGFRTLTTITITGNLSDGDIGAPIDSDIISVLKNIIDVRSVYFASLGQYWCAVMYPGQCDVFVFTYSKTDKINAWSRYRFTGITQIDDFAELNGNVYFRSNNAVYRVDLAATDDDGTPFSFQVTTPFLDFKKSGSMKNIGGLDYVVAGACTVALNTPTETAAESLTIDNTADEDSSGHKLLAAIQLLTTDVQVNITGTSTSEPFQLDELTFYYDDLGNV